MREGAANVTELLQMLQSRNNFTLYRTKVPNPFFARARGHACVSLFLVYIRVGKLEAGSWRQAGKGLETCGLSELESWFAGC